MLKALRTLLLVPVVAFGCTPAHAGETVNQLLERRIEWITEHFSELSYAGQPLPKVKSIPRENLTNMAGVSSGRNIKATYEHATNTMWVRDDFDVFELRAQYIVTHELVHYLQHLRDPVSKGECLPKREPEAYEVQKKFQREFGPWPPGWDMFYVFIVSTCDHLYP